MSPGWDPERYQGRHSYVWRFGADLIELLGPQPSERILDLGCGTGQLTAEIARSGAHVIGLDSSPGMLEQARSNYPALEFVLGDAAGFQLPGLFDAVFSNAALHWVKNAGAAVRSIAQALRPGGRFVAELGGKGNIASVQAALRAVFGPEADGRSPWIFPSIAEYAGLLEQQGLEVRQASLFDRPTVLDGPNAMEDWLRMFFHAYLAALPEARRDAAIAELVAQLRPTCLHDGVWTLDYRRLRILAVKTAA